MTTISSRPNRPRPTPGFPMTRTTTTTTSSTSVSPTTPTTPDSSDTAIHPLPIYLVDKWSSGLTKTRSRSSVNSRDKSRASVIDRKLENRRPSYPDVTFEDEDQDPELPLQGIKRNQIVREETGFIHGGPYIMSGSMRRKLVIMGAPSVGKTSLTQQYVSPPTYNESYFPTIEATSHKVINYDGEEYNCEIVDSAGQDEYTLFPSKYAIGVHGYLLVYSINSRQSFEMVQTVHNKILDFAGLEKVPCVIVGQKCDLDSSERRVTTIEGQELAKKLKAGFVECSAKDNKNVGKAFEALMNEMRMAYNPPPEKKKSSWWIWGR
ncbi:Ras family, other [Tremella mesenterica]|uniref:Ras family, other n=2 Tax=Tremella mesenterica TaxID=5217 RepID=A0A4Q1BCP0_TREME|nr:Ras family, other [Tremella mesenterica]